MNMFKVIQLMGDITDMAAFWGKIWNKGWVEGMEKVESNFYFGECSIWLGIYIYRSLTLW